MSELTHFDDSGASRMVDVGAKEITLRTARAGGTVLMRPATLRMISDRKLAKGDVLEVARLAGIMASKRTSDIIPLCHPIALDRADVRFEFAQDNQVTVEAIVSCQGRTGVEMEALTAVAAACLTIYDMCKAIDRGIRISNIRLLEKTGGRSGHFVHSNDDDDTSTANLT